MVDASIIRPVLLPLALAIGGAACSTKSVSQEPGVPAGECLLLRDNSSGVLGMDVGSSVSLGGGKSLFIFGDTFIGGWNSDGSRQIAAAVHSSTAVVDDAAAGTCFAGAAFTGSGGVPAQFLDPRDAGATEVWPLGPALFDGGQLDLAYTWVESSSDPLGFTTLGNGLVSGPPGSAPIDVDVAALSAPASEAMPAAWLIYNDYAYLYRCGSQLGAGDDPCIVGRAPLGEQSTLAAYQYFVADAGYTGTYQQATIVTEGAPAFSVTWNGWLGEFLEIYIEPFGPAVDARTAPVPEGPFSDKLALWPCSLPADDPSSYCYAGFQHPQLGAADGHDIVLSYSTNTTDFSSLLEHPNLYWPRLAAVGLADAGVHSALPR